MLVILGSKLYQRGNLRNGGCCVHAAFNVTVTSSVGKSVLCSGKMYSTLTFTVFCPVLALSKLFKFDVVVVYGVPSYVTVYFRYFC